MNEIAQPSRFESYDQAAQFIEQFAARAQRLATPCGDGRLIWHQFGTGCPEHPSLVFLHGGSGSWTHWIRNIEEFARTRRVLTVDLPGLGDSDLPHCAHSAEVLAAVLCTGLERLLEPEERFDLVGFSFGGILSGHVAVQMADRIHSLVIAGAPAFGLPSSGPINEVIPVPESASFDEARPIHEHNLRLFMIARPERVDPLAIWLHGENLRRSRLRSRKIARSDTLARALRRVRCPLAGIFGEMDVSISPSIEAHRSLFQEIDPESKFVVLPGTGHWAAYEDPERFNTELARILEQHRNQKRNLNR